jgi:hypothetical protein
MASSDEVEIRLGQETLSTDDSGVVYFMITTFRYPIAVLIVSNTNYSNHSHSTSHVGLHSTRCLGLCRQLHVTSSTQPEQQVTRKIGRISG